MPRKGSPYGAAHEARRRRLLGPGVACVHCGQLGADVADHQPPLSLHAHVAGSGCCISVPSCTPCSVKQGGMLRAARARARAPVPVPVDEDEVGLDVDDPVWQVPWLAELLEVPDDATWPRLMTAPHPAAVGSYGADAIEWLDRTAGITLRWWQSLVLTRMLEHDAAGVLVWLEVLLSTARQSGKSTLLRGGATWRLHQADLFGEEQTLLHTGKDLPVCKEVQRLARSWAKARGYPVREQNGNEQITEPESGSRWIVRGKGSVYGYPGSAVLVDEAWGVDPTVVEDGLEPTMSERLSPQMLLASTAHRRATPLFPLRRAAAIAELATPGATLLVEWSATRTATIDDRAAWRQASPHWGATRERLLEARLARVEAGEAVDTDDDDPVESFRSQYLNVWPDVLAPPGVGEVVVDADAWRSLHVAGGCTRHHRLWVAVEDNYGAGAAVAVVAATADDRYEVDGWLVDNRDDALTDARATVAAHGIPAIVIVGPSFDAGLQRVERAAAAETRFGLPLLRSLVRARRLVHDDTDELDAQLAACRVRQVSGGLALVAGQRADLVRATVWALRAAVVRRPEPSIR
jgi:hypothetical protein